MKARCTRSKQGVTARPAVNSEFRMPGALVAEGEEVIQARKADRGPAVERVARRSQDIEVLQDLSIVRDTWGGHVTCEYAMMFTNWARQTEFRYVRMLGGRGFQLGELGARDVRDLYCAVIRQAGELGLRVIIHAYTWDDRQQLQAVLYACLQHSNFRLELFVDHSKKVVEHRKRFQVT